MNENFEILFESGGEWTFTEETGERTGVPGETPRQPARKSN